MNYTGARQFRGITKLLRILGCAGLARLTKQNLWLGVGIHDFHFVDFGALKAPVVVFEYNNGYVGASEQYFSKGVSIHNFAFK